MKEGRFRNLPQAKAHRRALRTHGTPAEAKLWTLLKGKALYGRRFRRQYSVGPYILDFYCPEERLGLELDGAVHNDPARWEYDSRRQAYLHRQGIRVIRFENRQVFEQPEIVTEAIAWHFGGTSLE